VRADVADVGGRGGARHPTGELLEQAASSSAKLNEMLRDNSRDEITTSLEQYADAVLTTLGPSFLEHVERDVLERKYTPGAPAPAPPPPARESNPQTDDDEAEEAAAAAAAIASMASPSLGAGGGRAGGSVAAVSPSVGQPSAHKRPRDDGAGPSTQAPNESGEDTEDDEASQRPVRATVNSPHLRSQYRSRLRVHPPSHMFPASRVCVRARARRLRGPAQSAAAPLRGRCVLMCARVGADAGHASSNRPRGCIRPARRCCGAAWTLCRR